MSQQAVGTTEPMLPARGVYRHFKGGEYEVLSVARHSETNEVLVVYCSRADPGQTWVRPVDMFTGLVEGPEGIHPRFQLKTPVNARSRPGLLKRLAAVLDRADRRLNPRSRHRSHGADSGLFEI